jgi:putative heme-binding domain-containing protein
VRYKNTPRVTGFDLAKESDDQLIERLHSPNGYFRDIAQRLLSERNQPATRPKLEALVLDEDAPRKARMHALWAIAGTGAIDEAFHVKQLSHADSVLRAWGVRIAGNQGDVSPQISSRIVALAKEEAPDVQLQVAIASRKLKDFPAIPVLLTVLAHSGEDKLLPHIVWQNLHPLIESQTDVFLGQLTNWKQLGFPHMSEIMPRVVERMVGRSDRDPAPVARLFALLADEPGANPQAAGQTLQILAARVQSREIAGGELAKLRELMEPQVRKIIAVGVANPLYFDSALLATTWKDSAGLDAVRQAFTATNAPSERRLQALDALIAAGDESLLAAVEQVLSQRKENPPEFRGQVVASLGRMESPRVAEVLLVHYSELEPELKPRVIELLTQRLAWSRQLLEAIGKKQVPVDGLNLNQVRRLLALGDEKLAEQIRATWGAVRDERNPQRELIIAEMKTFIRSNPGDPLAGEKAYKKVCGQCHKIHGEGTEVGPDITLNGRNSFEQLLSNVFDPSLVIGAAYRAHIVVTTDGRVLTGLLVEETPQRIVLKVQGGKLETIARDDIEIAKASEVSMMPEQLEKQLQPQEIADLFAFLTLDKHPSDPTARRLPGVREVVPRSSGDPKQAAEILAEVLPGFTTKAAGEGGVALLSEHFGRSAVIRTHPIKQGEPCVLSGTFALPAGTKPQLQLAVSHHPQGDWQLIAKVNGETLLKTPVGPKTTDHGWAEFALDLSRFAGQSVQIELFNQPTDWSYEFGYWGRAAITP